MCFVSICYGGEAIGSPCLALGDFAIEGKVAAGALAGELR